jgi:hypothetical protein
MIGVKFAIKHEGRALIGDEMGLGREKLLIYIFPKLKFSQSSCFFLIFKGKLFKV